MRWRRNRFTFTKVLATRENTKVLMAPTSAAKARRIRSSAEAYCHMMRYMPNSAYTMMLITVMAGARRK